MLVRTDAVSRRFAEHTAVDRVDLVVDREEVVGLLGANGAGKTTLVRLLLGLLAPSAGSVELLGAPPSRAARARVGYLPQGLGLYEDLTIAQQLEFTGRVYGYDTTPSAIPGEMDRPIGALPLGARRLTAFAMATGHRPDLLLLDEPTSGLDPLGRARLWERIRDHAERGSGVVISTHYMSEAAQCDRVVILSNGQIVAQGTVPDVVAGHHSIAVETAQWQRAFAALDAADLPVALAGRRLRVVDTAADIVAATLANADVDATTAQVAATLEEVFVQLASHRTG